MNSPINNLDIDYQSRILVVDDDKSVCQLFYDILAAENYLVNCSYTIKDTLNKVLDFMPDLVFLDIHLPDGNGIDIIANIKKCDPNIVIIVISADETVENAVQAIKLGAYDYIPKPIPTKRLKIIVSNALDAQRLSRQTNQLIYGNLTDTLVGQSLPMQYLHTIIKCVALHNISVILRGESGTGKELVARAIHSLSERKDKPFIPVDCSAWPETLIESELFGYEKGAFTGASAVKKGKFELADGGTLFLDEIGNLTMHNQAKLLRVLQEKTINRLGSSESITIDVRIIAATNIDMEDAVKKGSFRNDLYYRLNVFEIILPPLNKREDDIILLSKYFLDKFNKEMSKNVKGFSNEVLSIFKSYSWPGNVRELEHIIKSSMVMAKDVVLPSHLQFHMRKNAENASNSQLKPSIELSGTELEKYERIPLKEAKRNIINELEKRLIKKVLMETNWNKTKAAELLDIDYKSIFVKIKKYGIKR